MNSDIAEKREVGMIDQKERYCDFILAQIKFIEEKPDSWVERIRSLDSNENDEEFLNCGIEMSTD